MKTGIAIGLLALLGLAAFFWIRREPGPVARIEIHKAARELRLVDERGRVVRKFRVALGADPISNKAVEGDGATPEGTYFVCVKNPNSLFYLSLGISYPGPADGERGFAEGLISESERRAIAQAHERGAVPPWKTALGGEVFIHGGGAGSDWTQGCVALEDVGMKELYARTPVGTPVRIFP